MIRPETQNQREERVPVSKIVVPRSALPPRQAHRKALEQIVEDHIGVGDDQVLLLLPERWTMHQNEEGTHYFDPKGRDRMWYHVLADGEARNTLEETTQIGKWTLTPLTRYYKRENQDTNNYEFVDRESGEILLEADTIPLDEPAIVTFEGGGTFDASQYLAAGKADLKLSAWADREYPDWQDPLAYWE